jgi:three-Cys-motif partner protein
MLYSMPTRRPPQEFINDITSADDGIVPIRDVPEWTLNKLGILWAYLSRYAQACQTAPAFYFVDGMAGSGLCRVKSTGQIVLGSTLIALKVNPQFSKCLALELDTAPFEALSIRRRIYGGRAQVENADCNTTLIERMAKHVPRNAPIFVLLDPEGPSCIGRP